MGRLIGAACGGLLVALVVMAGTVAGVVSALAGALTGPASTGSGSCAIPATARAGRPAGLTAEQAGNAATIVSVGTGMHVPAYGQVVAIATALQESGLINRRTATDHDSLGLFQQRPSAGWGTPAQLTTPAYAARAFYTHLLRVPGWAHLPVTVAAQKVQRSAYPNAYARHEARARTIVAALTGIAASCHPAPVSGPSGGWVAPVAGATISSGYRTPARPGHDGIDLAAPRGTPVRAASAGVVTVARCDPATGTCDRDGSLSVAGCGWYVEIGHPGPVTTRYCHLVRRPAVRVGQHVRAGQVVGAVGMSGNADGPHCHFEIHLGSPATSRNATNPQKFMDAHGAHL